MASSIAVVVIVAIGQAHDPATLSLVDAAHTAAGATVIVEEASSPSEDDALALASQDRADAVAIVVWDSDRSRATVHLHRANEPRWLDRAVGFQAADAPAERGRTIGFAIASMLPEPPPPSPPEDHPPPPPPETKTPPHDVVHVPEAPHVWHGAVDLSGLGSVALGGYGGGWGVQLAGHWYFLPHLSLRVAAGIREGGLITEAQGSAQTVMTSLGLGFRWIEPSPKQPFGLGGRVSLLAMRQSMTHLSADDVNSTVQSRWLPGADLLLEGAIYFVANVAVVLSTGVELAMGETQIFVAHRPVATLAPWRFAGETGFRARF